MTEQAKVPAIRFAGFTDPWEQRKLGELSSEFQSGDFISAEEILGSGPYPVYGGNGLRGYAKQYNHDGFYALIGRQGALCGNVNTAVGKAYFTEHAVAVKANFLHDTRFLAHLLGCMDLGRYSGQSAQPGLAVGVLKEVETTVPSKAEQQAIGSFFSRLDSLITLHQRKYDKLVIFKKSMLEKMFPKDGESVPEIRFAGFTDPWEQRKLGELFEESDERASDREILSVSVANGIYPASESDRETNPGASLANYKIVHFGDVVYNSMRMWQGAVDASRYDGIVSPAYVVARPNSEVYARFFARLLRQPMLLKQYQQVSQGNSKDTQVLKFDDFASIGISMPASENEQRRIGGFFDRLDSLITLHQRKLELLQNIKKSLLDKMFA